MLLLIVSEPSHHSLNLFYKKRTSITMTNSINNQNTTKPKRTRAEKNIRIYVTVLGNTAYVPEFKVRDWKRVVGGAIPDYTPLTGHGHAKLEDVRAELAELKTEYTQL